MMTIKRRGFPVPRKFKLPFFEFKGYGKSIEKLKAAVKNTDVGLDVASDMIKNAPYKELENGLLGIGNIPVHEIDDVVKSGNLPHLKSISESGATITAKDVTNYKNLTTEFPQSKLDDLNTKTASNKVKSPELDVKSADAASATTKKTIKKIEEKSMSIFKTGTKIGLVVGVGIIGYNWLTKATEARKGCFLVTVMNGKASSCRIAALSCVGGNDNNNCTSTYSIETLIQSNNAPLIAMYAISNPTYKARYNDALAQVSPDTKYDISDNLKDLINGETFSTVFMPAHNKFIAGLSTEDKTTLFNLSKLCSLTHPAIESGSVPACRLCDTSGDVSGTEYYDSSNLAENITYRCNANPTILETISDAIISTGENMLSWGSDIGTYLKYGIIASIAVIVLVLLVKLISILFRKKPPQIQQQQHQAVNYNYPAPPMHQY